MARKKRQEEHVNHERWLVSYADFITLLFAFFVVMYSVSSVNEGQYRVLSDSMVSAFRNPTASLNPIQVGQLVRSPLQMAKTNVDVSALPTPIMTPLLVEFHKSKDEKAKAAMSAVEEGGEGEFEVKKQEDDSFNQQALNAAEVEVNTIADGVEDKMEMLIDDEVVNIKRNKFWLEVEIKSSLLFSSGSSELIADSVPVLNKLSGVFADLPNRINVEGFTDNKPIKNQIFPSNWELSAARAAAVVRLFERNGIEPSRMASIGYGEYQPISDNGTDEGRAKNRRVVLVVMSAMEGRQNERSYEFELLKKKSAVLAGEN
ncbi:MAG: flagellar motor protein MotD [Porticoccus sp.]